MSWSVKYRIEWKSIHNVCCKVDILYQDYSGSITNLMPSDVPFIVNEDDDTNPFKPVRTQSGKIGIVIQDYSQLSLLNQLVPNTWNSAMVCAYRGNSLKWVGFVSPTSYTQPWVAPPFAVEIPVYDIVSSLYYTNIPTSMRIGNHLFAEIYLKSLENIFGTWGVENIYTVIQTDFASQHHIFEIMLPSSFYFDEVSSGSSSEDFSGISFGDAFEKILQLFGMNLRAFGTTCFFNFLSEPTTFDYIGNRTVYISDRLSMENIDLFLDDHYDIDFNSYYDDLYINNSDIVRDNGSVTINEAFKAVRISFPIAILQPVTYIMMPDYDEENAYRKNYGSYGFLIFNNLAPNCQAFFYKQDIAVTVYLDTDDQSPFYGKKIASITNTQSSGGSKNDLIAYLGQEAGLYPAIPRNPTSTPVTTRITEGAIMCKYALDSISEMKEGIFISSEPYQGYVTSDSASVLFTISTPAQVSFANGNLELSLGLFEFLNYPFSSGEQYQDFSIGDCNTKISVSLSIGNKQWTGLSGESSASECWATSNTPIIVYVTPNADPLKIKIAGQIEGIVTFRIHNCIPYPYGEYQILDPVVVRNTILFHLISKINITFSNSESSQFVSSRNENKYYETSSLYGEDKEIVLSVGSDQDNKNANNIIQDKNGNIIKTIEYTDGTTEHPEQHLAKRMAQYYKQKQFVYEITVDHTDVSPTDQVSYNGDARGLIVKEADWKEDTNTLVLIKQIQLEQ